MKKIYFILITLVSLISADNIYSIQSKILFDTNSTMSYIDIYSIKNQMKEVTQDKLSLGYKKETVWLYIKVKNLSTRPDNRYIVFINPMLDHLKIWEYDKKKVIDYYEIGDLEPFRNRKIKDEKLIIPYTVKPLEEKEFIIKINSESFMILTMKFINKDDYSQLEKKESIIIGAYYGAALIMLIYNLFLYSMIREKVYLYYVAFHMTFLLLQFSVSGMGFEYFWQETPIINQYISPILISLSNIFFILFMISFLNIKQLLPRVTKFYSYLIFVFIFLLVSTFILPYFLVIQVVLLANVLSMLIYFVVVVYIYISFHTQSSKIYLIAWSIFILCSIISVLPASGIIPVSNFTIHAPWIGSLFELSLLSLALAYKYNSILNKLTHTESELIKANTSLIEKVDEQTKSLKFAISELNHRIKNNFQFISTFLWAQKRSTNQPEVLKSLEQIEDRVYAISSLHEMLNAYNTISISSDEYLSRIINSYKLNNSSVTINSKIENTDIAYDDLVAIGLILNELLTNSFKYAFKGIKSPKIDIIFSRKNNKYFFSYKDNGIGCDIAKTNLDSGFGFKFINEFSNGFNGCKKTLNTNQHFYFELSFKGKKNNEN